MSILGSLGEPFNAPNVSIVEGDVGSDNFDAQWIVQQDNGIFLDYIVFNHYEHDFHRYMLGITSPGGFQGNKAAFVQLAAPTLLLICEWTARKSGAQPEIPNPNSVDPNWILLDVIPTLPMENISADGVLPVYRVSGIHVYGHVGPDDNTYNNVTFPHPPWLQLGVFTRTIQSNKLVANVTMPGTTGSISIGTIGAGGPTEPFTPPTVTAIKP